MEPIAPSAPLRAHLDAVGDVLARGASCLDRGRAAVMGEYAALRAEMARALRDYQVFKHDTIFDPAIGSDDAERAGLARAMKVECIAAGETFRRHMARWDEEAIRSDWAGYRPAARLTIGALRRHVAREAEGIAALLARGGCSSTA